MASYPINEDPEREELLSRRGLGRSRSIGDLLELASSSFPVHMNAKNKRRLNKPKKKIRDDSEKISSVSAFALGRKFDMAKLEEKIITLSEVIEMEEVLALKFSEGFCFFFPYAVVVFWSLNTVQRAHVLDLIASCVEEPFPGIDGDELEWQLGKENSVKQDTIILTSSDSKLLLSVSHALAQSVLLSTFETQVEELIEKTSPMVQNLALEGKTKTTSKETNLLIGTLFYIKAQVNLQSDVLHTPDFFWEEDEHEPFYKLMRVYMKITGRTNVVNQRLTEVGQLLSFVQESHKETTELRLEWIIILLIILEVLFEMCDIGLVLWQDLQTP